MPLVFPVPLSAHILSAVFASIYVGSIYLSENTRLSFSEKTLRVPNGQAQFREADERWRDDFFSLKLVCCCGIGNCDMLSWGI